MDSSVDPELCDSPIDQPPSSTPTSETSSAWASEPDLPLLSPVKATNKLAYLISSQKCHLRSLMQGGRRGSKKIKRGIKRSMQNAKKG